jgi:hypothetical protein
MTLARVLDTRLTTVVQPDHAGSTTLAGSTAVLYVLLVDPTEHHPSL